MPDRLSAFDTSLLYAEDAITPMHTASVALFSRPESDFDYDQLVELVRRRLALVPRYRQRVREVPGHLARPVWTDDENFDVAYHVRRSALPAPGNRAQLHELVGRLVARRLDRQRPLWEVYLVEGLADDQLAIVTKTHNALVDGIHAIELAQALLDPDAREGEPVAWKWTPRPSPSASRLVCDAVREALVSPAEILDTARTALTDVTATARRVVDVFGTVGDALISPVPSSALNTRVTAHRLFASADTRLEDYRAIRAAYGCTVNDVVLTVITGALRTWLASRGTQVSTAGVVRALVPLSAREPTDTGTRQETLVPVLVDLPVGEPNPAVRLRHVQHQLRAHAESRRSVTARALMRANGLAPTTLHALGARAASGFTRHVFNLVITNVPGPQVPLYAAGARMTAVYPVMPLLRTHALAIGVSSYDGGMYYGLNGDRNAMCDVDNLSRMIEQALAELAETVTGVRTEQS